MSTPNDRLTTRVLCDVESLESIAGEWRQLAAICPNGTPFQTPDWLIPWVKTFLPAELRVIEVRNRDRMIGLAPFLIYPQDSRRLLAFAGGGVSDYLGLLAPAELETQVLEAILRRVDAEPYWTTLYLTDLSRCSFLLRSPDIAPFACPHDRCSVLQLPQREDHLLPLFSKRQRTNLRSAVSRLQRAGASSVEVATSDTLPDFLADLFRLHTLRWSQAGEGGVLPAGPIRTFHRISAPRLLSAGMLRLHRLRVSERTAAVVYTLFFRDTVFCYLQGFDPEFSGLSPGTHLMFEILRDSVRRGMRKFDFLRGQEAYKKHWRPHVESTYRLELTREALQEAWLASARVA